MAVADQGPRFSSTPDRLTRTTQSAPWAAPTTARGLPEHRRGIPVESGTAEGGPFPERCARGTPGRAGRGAGRGPDTSGTRPRGSAASPSRILDERAVRQLHLLQRERIEIMLRDDELPWGRRLRDDAA